MPSFRFPHYAWIIFNGLLLRKDAAAAAMMSFFAIIAISFVRKTGH